MLLVRLPAFRVSLRRSWLLLVRDIFKVRDLNEHRLLLWVRRWQDCCSTDRKCEEAVS